MTEVRVEVYDRTNGEEHIGAYRAVAAPRVGDIVMAHIGQPPEVHMLRVEDIYWQAMPVHDVRAVAHGLFRPQALATVTIFGRATEGPYEP